MSATELLEKIKALPVRERRKFFQGVYHLEESLVCARALQGRENPQMNYSHKTPASC